MRKEDKKKLSKYIFWIIILFLVVLSFYILKPYLIPLISAFILSYLSLPLYKKLSKRISPSLSATICIILVIIIFIIPLGTIAGGITKQASSALNEQSFSSISDKISSFPLTKNIDLNTLTEKSLGLITSLIQTALSYIPTLVISLLVIFFGMFYILTGWDKLTKNLKNYLPFDDKEQISIEISNITKSLVYGTILIGIIEFIIAAIGFWISGVSSYLVLSAIVFFFAFIPGLGPTIVWVPMVVYYIFTKDYPTLIGVIITGLVLSGPIDTFLRAKILGGKTNLNPVLMLVGIMGGISLFGIFGFIIGPLVLIYTMKLIEESIARK